MYVCCTYILYVHTCTYTPFVNNKASSMATLLVQSRVWRVLHQSFLFPSTCICTCTQTHVHPVSEIHQSVPPIPSDVPLAIPEPGIYAHNNNVHVHVYIYMYMYNNNVHDHGHRESEYTKQV